MHGLANLTASRMSNLGVILRIPHDFGRLMCICSVYMFVHIFLYLSISHNFSCRFTIPHSCNEMIVISIFSCLAPLAWYIVFMLALVHMGNLSQLARNFVLFIWRSAIPLTGQSLRLCSGLLDLACKSVEMFC